MKLSILIPAYREQQTIREVLQRVLAIDVARLGLDKEIVVCDDGSPDDTARIVEELAAGEPRVRLVRHQHNQGKGAALRTALANASGDFVLIQDADLEYEVTDYPELLAPLVDGRAQVVYGSRFLRRRYPAGMHPANFVANKLLTMAANLLYGQRITDEATCFKVFRAEVLRSLDLRAQRFEFCPEVTAKLGLARVAIHEVPIAYRGRPVKEGKKVRWTDGVEALWVLLRERLRGSFCGPTREPSSRPTGDIATAHRSGWKLR